MSLINEKYDNILFEILQNEGQITPFLDAIFSFLYRRTDFYKIQRERNQSYGFPEGVAESLIRQVFTKYYAKAQEDDKAQEEMSLPDVLFEEVVGDTDTASLPKTKEGRCKAKAARRPVSQDAQGDGDCFNGANMGSYRWSQTVTEVDVRIQVPQEVVSGKDVRVQIRPDHLDVSVQEKHGTADSKWTTLVSGQFPHRVNTEDAIWTLMPGDHIHISLEKREDRLWEHLLEGEPKLDTRKLDNTLPMENLDESSQAVVQELMYNQKQKEMGKLTSKEQKIENILKEAWDIEGSPFKGQPFDLNKVKISNPEGLSRDI